MPGKVYLVGAGPGAPDLLTLRAARLLEAADIVFYDALVHADTVAIARNALKIPVGKRCGRHSTAQRFINKRLVDAAGKFDTVVRLKGGDPLLFGRAQEEIDALREARIECDVVPGITAALAASAELRISLTQRGKSRSVVFATPRKAEPSCGAGWLDGVVSSDTAVLYMAAGQAGEVASALIQAGMAADTPVAIVQSASLPDAVTFGTTLSGLRCEVKLPTGGPVLLLLGSAYRDLQSTRPLHACNTRAAAAGS